SRIRRVARPRCSRFVRSRPMSIVRSMVGAIGTSISPNAERSFFESRRPHGCHNREPSPTESDVRRIAGCLLATDRVDAPCTSLRRRGCMPENSVLDSTMYYEETGVGDPIVLLHGNPTSSFLWRKVIPGLADDGRVLAPDLIGMGRAGKPEIAYRFVDHARYLDAWFDALGLRRITLVGHDWGGALGFHWARRHPDRVAAMAFMETIIRPASWDEWPANARDIFQGFRTPGTGEQLILDQNMFVEGVLPAAMLHQLTPDERDAC